MNLNSTILSYWGYLWFSSFHLPSSYCLGEKKGTQFNFNIISKLHEMTYGDEYNSCKCFFKESWGKREEEAD